MEAIKQLIEDYERKLESIRILIKENQGKMAQGRLSAKAGCYRTFLTELKKIQNGSN